MIFRYVIGTQVSSPENQHLTPGRKLKNRNGGSNNLVENKSPSLNSQPWDGNALQMHQCSMKRHRWAWLYTQESERGRVAKKKREKKPAKTYNYSPKLTHLLQLASLAYVQRPQLYVCTMNTSEGAEAVSGSCYYCVIIEKVSSGSNVKLQHIKNQLIQK